MILEGGDDIDIGGNAAEGEEEEGSEAVKVCNVVSSGRFQQTNFGKKDYVAVYKAYMKVRTALALPHANAGSWMRVLALSILRDLTVPPATSLALQQVVKRLKQTNPDRVDAFKTVRRPSRQPRV